MKTLERGRVLIQDTILGLNSTWENPQHFSKQAGLRVLIGHRNFQKFQKDSLTPIRDIL